MKESKGGKVKISAGCAETQREAYNLTRFCEGCYLRHADVNNASSSCRYCFTGKILAPDTLVLPLVWNGINSLSVFSAINRLPVNSLANGTLNIDFSEVNYIDSSGLGSLVGLQKQLARQGTVIHIVGADEHVLRLLRTANLDKLFLIN